MSNFAFAFHKISFMAYIVFLIFRNDNVTGMSFTGGRYLNSFHVRICLNDLVKNDLKTTMLIYVLNYSILLQK